MQALVLQGFVHQVRNTHHADNQGFLAPVSRPDQIHAFGFDHPPRVRILLITNTLMLQLRMSRPIKTEHMSNRCLELPVDHCRAGVAQMMRIHKGKAAILADEPNRTIGV